MYILASASPRRKELFEMITADFTVMPADVDETLPQGIPAEEAPVYLAEKKAEHIAGMNKNDTVIGCDTVVIVDDMILGKPADAEDAHRMLSMLSGRVHKVITGVCVIENGEKHCFSECTEVEFYPLSDKLIDEYIATGDPFDKAGAYGIQTWSFRFVKGIKGDYFNVVGLPVGRLARALEGKE